MSDFDRGRILVQQDCSLFYISIAVCVGQSTMAVRIIWNQWVQEFHTECHARSQRCAVTNSLEGRYLICMTLMDHTTST